MQKSRIIIALDYPSAEAAMVLLEQLDPARCRVKIGKELFTATGPAFVSKLVQQGFDVFLDLKFHDIPNTVAKACQAAAELGVWMLNVHALGGGRMLTAAREAIDSSSHQPLLIAVTILTSMGSAELEQIGLSSDAKAHVRRLAQLAQKAGIDGVVCSPLEVAMLREHIAPSFKLVTPGIRPKGAAVGDQTRIMTPAEAIAAGSDYLVIGRPITQQSDPMAALAAIEKEIECS
ncbi:Orotidine 5'-phosphate decarboxylase [hydrothermal vent metagenome]|uniref:Orotidine 5'-phosphate decarboxylase n=1 Tax=hydrothermal vent metagenome TaxID=652676 RepID=A0A3B1BLH4_9ZZZZ